MGNSYEYQNFYRELIRRYWEHYLERSQPKPSKKNNLAFKSGKEGVVFGWSFHTNQRFSAEIYIDTRNKQYNQDILGTLKGKIGETPPGFYRLNWEELPNKRACRIATYKTGDIDSVSNNLKTREDLISWAIKKMLLLEETFSESIQSV